MRRNKFFFAFHDTGEAVKAARDNSRTAKRY
jgi:hypothetical protein